jgi:hypothetical protein
MREMSPLQPFTPTSIPQVLTPWPRETVLPRLHHDEHTRPTTDGRVLLLLLRLSQIPDLTTLCGSGGAVQGDLASSCKGYGYHEVYC